MKQILMFVMFASLLVWMMFSPVYKHVMITRHASLQKEVDYLLEVGASGTYGYIDEKMIQQSKERLGKNGFEPNKLIYWIETTSGVQGTDAFSRVKRGDGLQLHISYPFGELVWIDRFIGLNTISAENRMIASGIRMSEYVFP